MEFKRALVSVSDKSGLVDFLQPLVDQGLEVVSTGGTAEHLRKHNISVTDVSAVTDFPEVMDGRVKTLHPNIHMGLLARQENSEDQATLERFGLRQFDLVIGNLYPFEQARKQDKTQQELIEFIDIGGPSFLRAAAKNFSRITVLCDPKDYVNIEKYSDKEGRQKLAAKVFSHTAHYDMIISQTLDPSFEKESVVLGGALVSSLRYGENPHQQAAWFTNSLSRQGLHQAEILQGKQLSYNNLLDLDATTGTLQLFDSPTCVAVKHLNPCGVAQHDDLTQAVSLALKADPVSVFGGIVAINRTVNKEVAEMLVGLFLECVVAPDFSDEALTVLKQKKNLRVLKWPGIMDKESALQTKSISGGYLIQTQDHFEGESRQDWEIIGLDPDEQMEKNIIMGLRVCSRLKSNAIAILGQEQTVGLGMGQVNRVDAVKQAISRWQEFHADIKNVVLISDAFFPFADSIELCAEAGIRWVVQPGGSVKDPEVKEKAKELGVNLVLTGKRHFYH